ncbi:MAG: S24/S26 family peptidase [Bacilli bacterium]
MILKKMIGPLKIVVLLLMVILGVLAAYNIYSFGYRLLLGTKYAYLGGYATHQVNEDNMAPEYKKGDLVILKKNDVYKIDDIILYSYHGSYRLAKVVDYSNGIYTITDNLNSIEDGYTVNDKMIIGYITDSYKNYGLIYSIITSPLSIVFFMLAIGGYFFLTLGDRA